MSLVGAASAAVGLVGVFSVAAGVPWVRWSSALLRAIICMALIVQMRDAGLFDQSEGGLMGWSRQAGAGVVTVLAVGGSASVCQPVAV